MGSSGGGNGKVWEWVDLLIGFVIHGVRWWWRQIGEAFIDDPLSINKVCAISLEDGFLLYESTCEI